MFDTIITFLVLGAPMIALIISLNFLTENLDEWVNRSDDEIRKEAWRRLP